MTKVEVVATSGDGHDLAGSIPPTASGGDVEEGAPFRGQSLDLPREERERLELGADAANLGLSRKPTGASSLWSSLFRGTRRGEQKDCSQALCIIGCARLGHPKLQGGSQGGQPLWLTTTRTLLLCASSGVQGWCT